MFRGLILKRKPPALRSEDGTEKNNEVCRAEASRLPMNAHNESKI
jgi:hypothetical protein